MHVRVRVIGKPDTVVVVESKLTKIEQFRKIINDKFGVQPKLQRLLYGGKFLENGYTFHDYNIKLNDVIQLMVKAQPDEESEPEKKEIKKTKDIAESKDDAEKTEYRDAESTLYAVGDLVDMRDKELGAWFEGKIVRIVFDPQIQHVHIVNGNSENDESEPSSDKENDSESNRVTEKSNQSKQRGIAKYFSISPRPVKKKCMENVQNENTGKINDANLLYQIQLDAEEDNSNQYAQLKDIRPRARKEIAVSDLKIGQKVMINHNTEEPFEKGHWYDFKIEEIKKQRTSYELVGTLFLGPEAVPQNDTKVKIHDKIYEIEEVVPLKNRSEEYKKMMVTQPEKRALPLNCLTCRDDEDTGCKDCGCYLCSGKEFPEKIILCDECNRGYHMGCLSPPLKDVPVDDWYCPACKRDPHEVIAPGAAKQVKKTNASKTNRDWGRGMACVGKTKECLMPPNHFGPIPGIEVGMCWRFRIQLSESGVHRPPVSGIHGRDTEGAYSIVLSGGYEDDVDHGNEFTYTGSGGRDLSGNKRTAEQSCDQTLTRENRALARNCAAKHPISEGGGDAGAAWREGKPVRVVRSYKMLKHFPKFAPKEGIRYDGIYKVVKYYPEQGLSGFRVWKYLLRRDDPAPAPWEPHAKLFPIVYPDGYLEAEAEKRALKEKNNQAKSASKNNKKGIRQSNKKKDVRQTKKRIHEDDESSDETSSGDTEMNGVSKTKKDAPPAKKKKIDYKFKTSSPGCDPKLSNNGEGFNGTTEPHQEEKDKREVDPIEDQIKEFTTNSKLWDECLEVLRSRGKKAFTDQVAQVFMCNICQGLAVDPVTTPCHHNFCLACLRNASKNVSSISCPCCRGPVPATDAAAINEPLQKALRIIFPGYDSRK